ncbi:hypothetical protein F4780DRAFT_115343 [Xylariomycetidae sp. FL0641]|nr:hypothetical protein F4780DRAFT_115343 [Xylariomycetidae sp. FL0641]
MGDIDLSISNGTCWANNNVALPAEYIPCGNVATGGSYACCHYGDNCLDKHACYHAKHDITYLAGCTNQHYDGPACPKKGNYYDQQWVGLTRCDPDVDHWAGCPEADEVVGAELPTDCACNDTNSAILAAPSKIADVASLPQTLSGVISWFPGYEPTTAAAASSSSSSSTTTTSSTATGDAGATGVSSSTATTTSEASTEESPTAPPDPTTTQVIGSPAGASATSAATLSAGAQAGIGVGAGVGGLLVFSGLAFLLLRRRRRGTQPQPAFGGNAAWDPHPHPHPHPAMGGGGSSSNKGFFDAPPPPPPKNPYSAQEQAPFHKAELPVDNEPRSAGASSSIMGGSEGRFQAYDPRVHGDYERDRISRISGGTPGSPPSLPLSPATPVSPQTTGNPEAGAQQQQQQQQQPKDDAVHELQG